MTNAQYLRGLARVNVAEIAVQSVHENESNVLSDLVEANLRGVTFSGTKINETKPFTDWHETGEFHENLTFANEFDINLQSSGEGAEAVFGSFSYDETIAPSAKVLTPETKTKIQQSFINILQKTITT